MYSLETPNISRIIGLIFTRDSFAIISPLFLLLRDIGPSPSIIPARYASAVSMCILAGKPIIKGTRISVEFIVELLASGWAIDGILKNYPELKREDVLAALKYAAEVLREERIHPLP